MGTLPQLTPEDIEQLTTELHQLLANSDASTALVIDKGGFLITSAGDSSQFDLTTIAALASGAFMATQTIANLVQETNFNSVYQQGEKHSILAICVDEYCLLAVIFRAEVGVGAVKYFSLNAAPKVAEVMRKAHDRSPAESIDLSVLNIADTSQIFQKKS
jgi:predicted regulator of Ras-like GTPase activity (Roadblock/LC7/MglB family)